MVQDFLLFAIAYWIKKNSTQINTQPVFDVNTLMKFTEWKLLLLFFFNRDGRGKEKHKENMFGFGLFDLRERTLYLASLTFLSF